MLDFTEIPEGEGFELLVRDMLVAMGYRVAWSGRGPDRGKDLLVDEPGDSKFGAKSRRWLVSCKHNAHANDKKGRSVSPGDIEEGGGIVDAVDDHGASGFLVACSTQPSSSLVERLASIEARKGLPTHYWDCETLRHWLNTPACWGVAQRYMPMSADGHRVYATESPNKFIVISKGHFIRYANRHGSDIGFQLDWIEKRLEAIGKIELPKGFQVRMRGVWYNDKIGAVSWYLDCIYGESDFYADPGLSDEFGEGDVVRLIEEYLEEQGFDDFQINTYEVTMRTVNRVSDSYDPDHYSFYAQLPEYL
ncbi:restriction endonuclease [Rhodococcus sp. NPDC055112]